MGFYHPATLVKDAQHRQIRVRPIDVQESSWLCSVHLDDSVRLGFKYVKGLKKKSGQIIEEIRKSGNFRSIDDFRIRTGLQKAEMTVLAEIGALNCFGLKRRESLWQVEKSCRSAGPLFERLDSNFGKSPLQEMNSFERLDADYSNTRITIDRHPMALQRKRLASMGVWSAKGLEKVRNGKRVRVAGSVIVRQRPMTAKGFLFISLEDETGISNIVVRPHIFEKNRLTLTQNPFLLFEGILQNQDNVISVRAEKVKKLEILESSITSYDFH
jgi:error-prone DNA polymerase